MKKIVFGLLSLTLLATACKKSKDAPAVTKENIAGTYKLMSIKVSINGSGEIDADQREVCEKDNLYKLNADNTFQYVDAGTVCDPDESTEGNWSLTDKTISSESYPDLNGDVTRFDGTNMDITIITTEGDNTYKVKSTFQKQ